jgi:hypothetical protein
MEGQMRNHCNRNPRESGDLVHTAIVAKHRIPAFAGISTKMVAAYCFAPTRPIAS